MENPKNRITLVKIRPEHAGEGISYLNPFGCGIIQALREAGIRNASAGGNYVRLDGNIKIYLEPPFDESDFLAVRAGRTVEYLYDEGNKTMTRVENAEKH